jgi:hypothetical protein
MEALASNVKISKGVQITLADVELGSELDLDDLDAGQLQNILSVGGR